jgi:hypothetical protein
MEKVVKVETEPVLDHIWSVVEYDNREENLSDDVRTVIGDPLPRAQAYAEAQRLNEQIDPEIPAYELSFRALPVAMINADWPQRAAASAG